MKQSVYAFGFHVLENVTLISEKKGLQRNVEPIFFVCLEILPLHKCILKAFLFLLGHIGIRTNED